jgi:anaerobic ribonucleoside-triphosphate reductase activating protein
MLIHAILPRSRVNGPGERFVVWTQGCSRGCPGCFNRQAQGKSPPGKAMRLSVGEIVSRIPLGEVGGISVSGGEPFEQPEELLGLLVSARRLGLHTLVYSGFTYGELRESARGILREIDILIDGPYIRDIPPASPWAGSGNQRIICLERGEVAAWESVFPRGRPEAEIFIDPGGNITETGLFGLCGEPERNQLREEKRK